MDVESEVKSLSMPGEARRPRFSLAGFLQYLVLTMSIIFLLIFATGRAAPLMDLYKVEPSGYGHAFVLIEAVLMLVVLIVGLVRFARLSKNRRWALPSGVSTKYFIFEKVYPLIAPKLLFYLFYYPRTDSPPPFVPPELRSVDLPHLYLAYFKAHRRLYDIGWALVLCYLAFFFYFFHLLPPMRSVFAQTLTYHLFVLITFSQFFELSLFLYSSIETKFKHEE